MREEEMLRWTHLVGKATAVGVKEVEETAVGVKEVAETAVGVKEAEVTAVADSCLGNRCPARCRMLGTTCPRCPR
jgi:hypothetical protein